MLEPKILEVIKIGDKQTAKEIARKLGLSYPTVLKYLHILKAKDLIEVEEYGRTKVWFRKEYFPYKERKRGWVEVGPTRICLLTVNGSLYYMKKEFQNKIGEGEKELMYKVGYRAGKKYIEETRSLGLIEKSENGFRMMVETFAHAGFGNLIIEDLNWESGDAVIRCKDTAEGWGFVINNDFTEKCVCDFTRGNLKAFMRELRRLSGYQDHSEIECIEVSCIARRDRFCEFNIGVL